MVQESYHRCLSRLLLTFSDLCDSDEEVAQCLVFMRISPPPGQMKWSAELVRSLMPSAFSTATSSSPYSSNQSTPAADAYCLAVYNVIKARKESH